MSSTSNDTDYIQHPDKELVQEKPEEESSSSSVEKIPEKAFFIFQLGLQPKTNSPLNQNKQNVTKKFLRSRLVTITVPLLPAKSSSKLQLQFPSKKNRKVRTSKASKSPSLSLSKTMSFSVIPVRVSVIKFAPSFGHSNQPMSEKEAIESKRTDENEDKLKDIDTTPIIPKKILFGTVTRNRAINLLQNKEIFDSFKKELEKIKNTSQLPKGSRNKESNMSEKSDSAITMYSIPKQSPFYPKTPKCPYDCSFELKLLPKSKKNTGEETLQEFNKRVKMNLNIKNDLLEKIMNENHKPLMARQIVNTNKVSKEVREANNLASRKSRLKQTLLSRLLDDSVRAQNMKIWMSNQVKKMAFINVEQENNKKSE